MEFLDSRENGQQGYVSGSTPIGTGIRRSANSPGSAPPRYVATGNNSGVVVTTVPAQILAANNDRCYLFIQNLGLFNIYIHFGSFPAAAPGPFVGSMLIGPNGWYEFNDVVLVNTVYAVASAGSNNVTVIQGTRQTVYG